MKDRTVASLILEVFSIVLGVLLALAVSEWQEQQDRDELVQLALTNIASEMAANEEILTTLHARNQATIEAAYPQEPAADEELNEEEGASDDAAQSAPFSPGVQLRSTAWEAMLSSGASSYADYNLLLTLSRTYSRQAIYRDMGLKLVETSMTMAAMATVNSTAIDSQQFLDQFSAFFTMMLQMEETLLEDYAATRALLDQ